ncbi:MAG: tetratricopeptide repeat protein [Arcicella sp.]|nr:tetratricopeptide repeat protein [Arcicella sp.]
MKLILATTLLLFFISTAHAQKPSKLDSLKNILAHLPAEGESFTGDTLRVRVLCEMGEEDAKEAELIFQKAISISTKYLDNRFVTFSKFRYAIFYKKRGMFFYAIPKFFDLLPNLEKSGNFNFLASVYRELGDSYLRLNSFQNAEKYYKLSSDYFKKIKNFTEYVDTQNNFGLVYYNKRDFMSAIRLFEECKLYESKVANTIYEASYLSNLGSCYRELSKFALSQQYFNKAVNIYKNLNSKYLPYLSTTLIEYALLLEKEGKIQEAILMSEKAYNINHNDYGNDVYTNEILQRLYSKSGNFEKAFYHSKSLMEGKEKQATRSQQEKIASLRNDYDLKQQKNTNLLLVKSIEKEALINKLYIIGIITVLGFVAYFIYLNQILKKRQKEIEEKSDSLDFAKKELELINENLEITIDDRTKELREANGILLMKNKEILEAMTKGQTIERKRVASSLHDNLGSTISAIKWRLSALELKNLTQNEQKIYDSIIEMVNNAYSEVRFISHNFIPKELEISGLRVALEKFINEINQTKFSYIALSYNIDYQLPENVVVEVYSICLELINNIFKHSKAKNGLINIYVKNQSILNIEVCDDGIGINQTENKTGIGLKNIEDRLHSINGKYFLNSNEKFNTIIFIEIPLL